MTASLAGSVTRLMDLDPRIRLQAYDGSAAGPEQAPVTLTLRSDNAIRYVATAPGGLGLARAFVAGDLEVSGDLYSGLSALDTPRIGVDAASDVLSILRSIGPRVLSRPPIPEEEASPPWRRGLRHSKRRDAAAIAHHYDVSNRFYELILGSSMTYTCALFETPAARLEEAQLAKHDLVARKLALEPGMRLLDVGCGWGGMVMRAAEHYGVQALGVTLSQHQAEWAQRAIASRGLSDRAEVRHIDYRDLHASGFDAISSIGLSEHVGARGIPKYVTSLHSKLRAGGRLLNHCITRPNTAPARAGGFIDRYVFPDGELESPGALVSAIEDNGFEVRHVENLREHYSMTLREWGANLQANWEEAVASVGERRARIWLLYMAASRVGFDRNRLQLHQVLAVKPHADGRSCLPLRPKWDS